MDRENAVDPQAAWMKREIVNVVANRPATITKFPSFEASLRHFYREGATRLLDGLARCKTTEDVKDFLKEWQDAAEGRQPISEPFKPEAWLVSPGTLKEELTDDKEVKFLYKGEEITRDSDPKIIHAAWASISGYDTLRDVTMAVPGGRVEYSSIRKQKYFADKIGLKEVAEMDDGQIQLLGAGRGKEMYGQYTIAFGSKFANLVNMEVPKRRGVPGLAKYKAYDYGSYSWEVEHPSRKALEKQAADVKGWDWSLLKTKEKKAKPKTEIKEILKTDKRWVWTRTTGEAKRSGPSVKPPKDSQEFAKSFGMKQVNYGSWANDAEREWHVTSGNEALHDLAQVLGIDSKMIAVNGRLKMAFGARGTGGKRAPVAHYEPGNQVINLTKLKGAGSLAHEWGHFLDNAIMLGTVGHQGSKAVHLSDIAENQERSLVRKGVPADIVSAMRAVMETIKYHAETDEQRKDRLGRVRERLNSSVETMNKLNAEILGDAVRNWDYEKKRAVRQAWMDKKGLKWAPIGGTEPPPGGWSEADRVAKPDTSKVTADEISAYDAYNAKRDNYRKLGEEYEDIRREHKSKLPTDHYREAQAIGGTYYSSDVELFARAFESYVEDKLHSAGQENTYLVAGTRALHVGGGAQMKIKAPEPGIYVDPDHPHRQQINSSMDKLVAALRKNDQFRKSLEAFAV
jgi:hypothetical protein